MLKRRNGRFARPKARSPAQELGALSRARSFSRVSIPHVRAWDLAVPGSITVRELQLTYYTCNHCGGVSELRPPFADEAGAPVQVVIFG